MTTWSKFMRFARALAGPDAVAIIRSARDPVVAALDLVEPFIVNDRLRAQDDRSRRPRTLLARGGSR
jgi:hypothetical protein